MSNVTGLFEQTPSTYSPQTQGTDQALTELDASTAAEFRVLSRDEGLDVNLKSLEKKHSGLAYITEAPDPSKAVPDLHPKSSKHNKSDLPLTSTTSADVESIDEPYDDQGQDYSRKWILNMSINFLHPEDREKFFVTYVESDTCWRRITISVQYRNAPEDSLEAELKSLRSQSERSLCIWDALQDSLPTIHFFDTVTNLKLATGVDDGQLHVHVREDTNEVIEFPGTRMVEHIHCPRYKEDLLQLDSHISGFVYRVVAGEEVLVRKDIPSRDSVDEFMYELNALNRLNGCPNIIQLYGLVTDEDEKCVKGLLLRYAPGGSLADILFDEDEEAISPSRREKWAYQITKGLADIHEAGFVQGDFTLSNIVIDEDDNARIIDINRRGCPLGWEPPELLPMIQAGNRISMYISAKTDLYQLGMVLWALAEHNDNPNQHEFGPVQDLQVSMEYQEVVSICLSRHPKHRLSAIQLVSFFPQARGDLQSREFGQGWSSQVLSRRSLNMSDEDCDPRLAVTLDEVKEHQRLRSPPSLSFAERAGRNQSFESRYSSAHGYQGSEVWSVGPCRDRTNHDHLEMCSRALTSRTSLSSTLDRGQDQVTGRQQDLAEDEQTTAVINPKDLCEDNATVPPWKLSYRDSGFDEPAADVEPPPDAQAMPG